MTMNKQSNGSMTQLRFRFFKDRPASERTGAIVYEGGLYTDGAYTTGSISSSVTTPSTSRIGEVVTAIPVVSKSFESIGIGGKRVGPVLVLDNTIPDEQINLRYLDAFRSGKDIKNYTHFSSGRFRPMIRISPEGFFEEEDSEIINHYGSFHAFGTGETHNIVDSEGVFLPYKDYSQLIPSKLLGKLSVNEFPFAFTENNDVFKQFNDPIDAGLNGAIDVFNVRNSLTNTSIDDISLYGIKISMQGGDIESSHVGSTQISTRRELSGSITTRHFFDSQEVEFTNFTFPAIGVSGSSGYQWNMPGFVDQNVYSVSFFNDSVDHIKSSYKLGNVSNLTNFLSSSRNRISEVGSRFKSSTCGLIFGESNALGTDSIAFGGLKK